MPSFFKSNKGVETAPLVIAFSAIVILLAATMILPQLGKWNATLDNAKALREANRLAAACNEVLKMGESGSVEEVYVDIPASCCVQVTDPEDLYGMHLYSYCSIPNQNFERKAIPTEGYLKTKIDNNRICGTSVDVIIAYGDEDNSIPKGSYIIYVSNKKPFIR
jgi:type II secretory pathway pseudopilin PulG